MRDWLACICATALLTGCDGAPTAADRVVAPASASPPMATHAVFGVVTATGAPVVAARVIVWHGGAVGVEVASATTDGTGYYRMSDVRPSSRFGEMVFVSKPGYFMEFKYINLSKDTQVDVALAPWVHIALDAVVRGRVGDTLCEGWGPCERFAFTPPSSATLELTSPAFPFDLEVLKPNGLAAAFAYSRPGVSSPLQLSVSVDAGVTYEINVYYPPGGSTRDFVLTTALR